MSLEALQKAQEANRESLTRDAILEDEKIRAEQDLIAIQQLLDCPGFTGYFMRRLKQKMAEVDTSILEGVPPHAYDFALVERRAYLKIINLISTDKASCRMTLKSKDHSGI